MITDNQLHRFMQAQADALHDLIVKQRLNPRDLCDYCKDVRQVIGHAELMLNAYELQELLAADPQRGGSVG